ncbi:Uncharacterized protein PECH_003833 [Penicillium ucsense]|uniref:5'-3' DNA helicase ZGRF1-like N-terminal domain-containing protein n=1 Tax=Penicillium ucsense TaxID=2839758 RepID=A0A8J8VWM6_9EURO|nr:Uncharacterized protein PECM_001710 [Penicillium ucsense]KAF7737383.1 Uncharacterized protein PECH_003833 [Penicillium ucsense]
MSTPITLTPRGTAPTSTTASPLTASVIKFRCLYTHDLRRKTKRWQDGYLKYHAFNKRVMVYDETGNYIGDHHWRANEEVQDGDEMELDKGALIQVGERMETTQTDLTNLLEKRKSSQGSPQASGSISQTPRASAPTRSSASSQPFRSLNELLGIKKTQVGHLASPYEERHSVGSSAPTSQADDRASKRQKVQTAGPATRNKQLSQSPVVDLTGQEDESPLAAVQDLEKRKKLAREKNLAREQRLRNLGNEPQRPSAGMSQDILIPSTSPKTSARLNRGVQAHQPPKPAKDPLSSSNPSRESTGLPVSNTDNRKAPIRGPTSESPQASSSITPLSNQATTCTDTGRAAAGSPQRKPRLEKPTTQDSTAFKKPALPDVTRAVSPPRPMTAAPWKETETVFSNSACAAVDPTKGPLSKPPSTMLRLASGKPRRKLMYSALLPSDSSQGSTSEQQPKSSVGSMSSSFPGRSKLKIKSRESQDATAPVQVEASPAEFLPSASTQFVLEEMMAPTIGPSSIPPKEEFQRSSLIANLPPKAPSRSIMNLLKKARGQLKPLIYLIFGRLVVQSPEIWAQKHTACIEL